MSSLRVLIGTTWGLGRPGRLRDGLSPDDSVLLDAPDRRLAPALVSAALGEYEDAAKLLATTRDAAEWEDRDRYVTRLGTFAHRRDGWLTRWLESAPGDPDALAVAAELALRRAWESPARAELLRDVTPLIDAAAAGSPHDPVPWRLALDLARGAHAAPAAFEELWARARVDARGHYGCHVSALLHLSARWHGSHRVCARFAERAALGAPPDSLLRALPVRAAFTRLLDGAPPPEAARAVDSAADLAIGLSAAYPAGDPWPAEVRNLLAYVLVRRGRRADALEQFRLIGPHATSFPWSCVSDDPLAAFLRTREAAGRRRTFRTALCTGSGRRASHAHYAWRS